MLKLFSGGNKGFGRNKNLRSRPGNLFISNTYANQWLWGTGSQCALDERDTQISCIALKGNLTQFQSCNSDYFFWNSLMPTWCFNTDRLATWKVSQCMCVVTGPKQPCRMSGQISPALHQEVTNHAACVSWGLQAVHRQLFKFAFSCCH